MATQLTGDYVIRTTEVRIELVAETIRFGLALANVGSGIWKYNVSLVSEETRSQSVASGRVIADDALAAAWRVAAVAGEGYEPGSVERGLFDALAAGGISGWQQNLGEAGRIARAIKAVKGGTAVITEISESEL
jgi:hypothetical protein